MDYEICEICHKHTFSACKDIFCSKCGHMLNNYKELKRRESQRQRVSSAMYSSFDERAYERDKTRKEIIEQRIENRDYYDN